MSVIRYQSEEDIEEIQEETENTPQVIKSVKKMRLAFVGTSFSGKTSAAEYIKQQLEVENPDTVVNSFHMNDLITQVDNNETSTVLRKIHGGACEHLQEELADYLNESSDADVLLVEDPRFAWELKVLKEHNFKFVYLNTPWHERLRRIIKNNNKDLDVKWIINPIELDLENIPMSYWDCVHSFSSSYEDLYKNLSI